MAISAEAIKNIIFSSYEYYSKEDKEDILEFMQTFVEKHKTDLKITNKIDNTNNL